jgi:hypothetical protein
MANPTTDTNKNKDKSKSAASVREPEYPLTTMAVVAPIVGWLIPGGGHILLKRYDDFGGRDVPDWAWHAGTDLQAKWR